MNHSPFSCEPVAAPEAVINLGHLRISILTSRLIKIRKEEVAKVQHYPSKAKHIPTAIHGNYDDPDQPSNGCV